MASHQTLETSGEHKLPATENENSSTRSDKVQRAQWLRAAILGASDGLLSTTSLMLGVGAVKEDRWSMILSGIAGAIAGACSMAVGEFVSVATQRDIERTSLRQQSSLNTELGKKDINGKVKLDIPERSNLTISIESTPSRTIPCGNPACDNPPKKMLPTVEIIENDEEGRSLPSPHKAASASALAFLCGSLVPLISAIFIVQCMARMLVVVAVTSISLALFGGMGASMGGSPAMPSAVRVLIGGWIAMAITYGLLMPFEKEDHNEKD